MRARPLLRAFTGRAIIAPSSGRVSRRPGRRKDRIMESMDLEVLRTGARWLGDGRRALLVTVVR
ncbi:hypothetical protein, partial [Burkholderia sp. BDU5]|uniref:hypothetical protein n=1 Tax=Burkholderia sp. BDU5 TaxID=1385590 RepID=UPI0012E3E41E